MTAEFFRDLVARCDAMQRAEHLTDTQMAERGGMRREQYIRARGKANGKGDVETQTAAAFARIACARVGVLSGAPDPLTAALTDAAEALQRTAAAAELAVDRGALSLIRPAIRDLERLLGAPPAPALRLQDTIHALGISARAWAALRSARVTKIRDLTTRTPNDLLAIDGFGPGCLSEVEAALAAHGLRLAGGAS